MSKYYKTKENVAFDTIVNLVMIFTLLVCFLPFVYMAALSFSSSKAIINNQVLFWPVGFNLDAYKQIFHVTIPSIMPTIMVMLIMNVGRMLSIGYEKVLLMYTPSNSGVSDIIDTLVYRTGLQNQNYSYATAIGLFGGIIGLILVSGSNAISKKLTDESLY